MTRMEDVAKYSAVIMMHLPEGRKQELWTEHGICGVAYKVAGIAMRFERKTRRRDWTWTAETKGWTWDWELLHSPEVLSLYKEES